jgi:hypothetical protein
MGGRVSKAKRACTASRDISYNAGGDVTGASLSAGVTVNKTYDTQCVQQMLSGGK